MTATSSPSLSAFGDESFREHQAGGVYVLAAAVFNPRLHESVREVMRDQLGALKATKWHWSEMDDRRRVDAALALAALDGFHVVAVGTPVPRRRQERARAVCLRRLVYELHGFGVSELILEGRTTHLNRRDVQTVVGARFQLPKGSTFTIRHQHGYHEPLLWAADVIAGAVRASTEGDITARAVLDEQIYAIHLDTGC